MPVAPCRPRYRAMQSPPGCARRRVDAERLEHAERERHRPDHVVELLEADDGGAGRSVLGVWGSLPLGKVAPAEHALRGDLRGGSLFFFKQKTAYEVVR